MARIQIEIDPDFVVKQTPESLLFDFLHKVQQHHRSPKISKMFNIELSLENTLLSARPYLEEAQSGFTEKTSSGTVLLDGAQYVHVDDILSGSVEKRQLLIRDLLKLPKNKRKETVCPIHQKQCRLVECKYGFICYLHMVAEDIEFPEEEGHGSRSKHVETEADVNETEDVVEEIDVDAERQSSANLNLAELQQIQDIPPVSDLAAFSEKDGVVLTPILPVFYVGDSEYILINDIQRIFDLREDYCLAIIAQSLEADEEFIDQDIDKYSLMDSHAKDSEFRSAAETLLMMYKDAILYERNLPSEVEFQEAQERLNITRMGREETTPTVPLDNKTSINIWTDDLLVSDENQKLVVFQDNFLRRAKGKRMAGLGHDSALGAYIGSLKFPIVTIFHRRFSNDNADFPLFAIKTLSRYAGGHPIRWNAEKVILVEKEVAVRIFGQGPGINLFRSNYYLACTAYGLKCGIRDPTLLCNYSNRELLRLTLPQISAIQHESVAGPSSKRPRLVDREDETEK